VCSLSCFDFRIDIKSHRLCLFKPAQAPLLPSPHEDDGRRTLAMGEKAKHDHEVSSLSGWRRCPHSLPRRLSPPPPRRPLQGLIALPPSRPPRNRAYVLIREAEQQHGRNEQCLARCKPVGGLAPQILSGSHASSAKGGSQAY
jgi:hypothetical protein